MIGGSGGLGMALKPLLEQDFEVVALSSGDLDITDASAVTDWFASAQADIVLNLAGISFNVFLHKIQPNQQADIRRMTDVNINGTINVFAGALPPMRERGYGRIIMMSSVLAEHPVMGAGIYSGCKGFIDSITRTAALENAAKGITCNSIQLGYFDAGLLYQIPENLREQIRGTIPVGRWGTIQELVNVLRMIIDTPYLNGVNLPINGGIRF